MSVRLLFSYLARMSMYLFSDAHLGAGTAEDEAVKLERIGRLFELVKTNGDRLVILGDLFDFWFEYRYVIPKAYHRVLFMLQELVAGGIRVDYISGNHDFWMGDFFTQHLGIHVHRDGFDTEYGGRRLHLIHGDGLSSSDRGYRLLKRILRNPFNVWLYRLLPPDWAYPLARKVSHSSRRRSETNDLSFARDYEAYARGKLADGFDVVAIGHIHLPVCLRYEDGVYVNTGDFIKHFSYARINAEGVHLDYLR